MKVVYLEISKMLISLSLLADSVRMFWLVCFLATAECINYNKTNLNTAVRIGVILPKDPITTPSGQIDQHAPNYPFFLQMVVPAIHIALETVKSSTLPNHDITIVWNDTKCDTVTSQIIAVDMFLQYKVDVFFGPACEFAAAPLARFTGHWNVPLLTAGCRSSGCDQYNLLTRMAGAYTKLGKSIVDMVTQHNWRRVLFMVDQGDNSFNDYSFACISPYNQMEKHRDSNYSLSSVVIQRDFTEQLNEVKLKARIVFICASSDTVRDIMIQAHDMEMTGGDYAFFSVNPFHSKYFGDPSWYRKEDSNETNEKAREAYRALMTIQLHSENKSADYDEFATKVKKRAKEDFGYSFDDKGEQVNSFVTAFHDAVILYALALNESLEDGGNPRNGTELSHRMRNRTFRGIAGDVTIDENGVRDSDYSLKEMNKDAGEFEVVGIFHSATQTFEMLEGKTIDWPGKDVTPDTPKYGFTEEVCPPNENNGMKYGMTALAVILNLFVIIIV